MLFLKFEIPKSKLYEFDLAIGRLVKWPVYSLYSKNELDRKSFEFIREWNTKEEMDNDLESPVFTNLMGAVKVLGTLKFLNIYEAKHITNSTSLNIN